MLLTEFLRSLIKDLTWGGCVFVHSALLRLCVFTIQTIDQVQLCLWLIDLKMMHVLRAMRTQSLSQSSSFSVWRHTYRNVCVRVGVFFLFGLMLINLVRKTKERADSDWQAAAAKGGGKRRKLRRRSGKKPFHTQRGGGFLKCATEGKSAESRLCVHSGVQMKSSSWVSSTTKSDIPCFLHRTSPTPSSTVTSTCASLSDFLFFFFFFFFLSVWMCHEFHILETWKLLSRKGTKILQQIRIFVGRGKTKCRLVYKIGLRQICPLQTEAELSHKRSEQEFPK